ncbi:MAG: zinc transporter ZupT, partial [Clostridia bacterium]|nr:zinc transporter ZupT [Clostridia bacterium]
MGGAMWPAFIMSALAGMSTAIGGIIAVVSKRTNERFLSASLGFSAGVMLLVSFDELLPDSKTSLQPFFGQRYAGLIAAASLVAGAAVALLISVAVPSDRPRKSTARAGTRNAPNSLIRVGIVTAVAVTV